MSDTSDVLLGVIAAALAVMAMIQVGAVVVGLRLARRIEQVASDLESGVKPLVANLTAMTADVTRATNLATTQMERFDKLFGELAVKVEQTLSSAQQMLATPAREGMAMLVGLRAAVSAFRTLRETSRRRSAARAATFEEEEESLFIG